MGLAGPTRKHAEEMLGPDGWAEVEENAHYDRAERYMQVLRQVSQALDNCIRERLDNFDSGGWSATASFAANGRVGTLIVAMATLQGGLVSVITWHRYIAGSIRHAKSDIYDNVEFAHTRIDALENDKRLTDAQRTAA